jgi:GTP cyclohydrolase I
MNKEAKKAVYEMIRLIGDNPSREGVIDTPKRVVKSWETIYGGYNQLAENILSSQFNSENYDEMVVLKNIEFFSTCEHHMLPFFGKAHVAYLPNGSVVGISKLARLVEVFSRRLQIQERLTTQIADSLMSIIKPIGCGVVIEAKHFCMISRGVNKQNSIMETSALRGSFKEPDTKQEFLKLINHS